MKKLFKKFLILYLTIGGILLISNKCFAENYKVRIIVLGNHQAGKSNIVNILNRNSFSSEHIATIWRSGNSPKGFRIDRYVNGDEYECYFYDAPGYIDSPNSNVEKQIEQVKLDKMSLAIIVIDYKDPDYDHNFANPVHEAVAKHVDNLRKKNNECSIVLVVNKSDLLTSDELNIINKKLASAADLHGTSFSDSVVISAKKGTNFGVFEDMIDRFLSENKNRFQNVKNSFFICHNCQGEYFYDGDDPSNNPGYCTMDCKRQCEGVLCANDKTDYDKKCPKGRPKLLPNEGIEGFWSHENKRYCCEECRGKSEGKKCENDGRYYAPSVPGVYGYSGCKWYCGSQCQNDARDTFTGKNCSVM